MPFWLGESLGRTRRAEPCRVAPERGRPTPARPTGVEACARWLLEELQLPGAAAQQLTLYLGASRAALGVLPSERRIVFERFFDEVGDTHLVIHSPYGSRINKAWGLALRKRMCRKFNFELQASALEDSIVLSLGPTHSFALDEVRHYLKAATARDILVQALLDAPMFGTRWRWNATAALAVRRMNGGRKTPPQFQRSDAQDLLTVVFPDQLACAENIVGEREIPDHPLVAQTLHDCLHETMDVDGFVRLLARIEARRGRDHHARSGVAVAAVARHPQRAALCLPGRRRGRGAAHQGGEHAAVDGPADGARHRPPRPAGDRAGVRGSLAARSAAPTSCTMRCCVHGFLTAAEADCPDFVAALERQRRVTRLQVACGRDRARRRRTAARIPGGVSRCANCRRRSTPSLRPGPRPKRRCARSCAAVWSCWGRSRAAALAAPLGMSADAVLPACCSWKPKAP